MVWKIKIKLRNINAKRDWGSAHEYVESMYKMLQEDKPRDYVIATNKTHTVEEFLQYTFECVGMDDHKYLVMHKEFLRLLDLTSLEGDFSKAKKNLTVSQGQNSQI